MFSEVGTSKLSRKTRWRVPIFLPASLPSLLTELGVDVPDTKGNESSNKEAPKDSFSITPPAITMPKGGGAIRGIGEKFTANPVTGTGSMSMPIATSPGRSGFGPQLALSYDSGAGNGPFGLGWNLALPAITRKAEKGLPRYRDDEHSDVFLLSGAEDLVSVLEAHARHGTRVS